MRRAKPARSTRPSVAVVVLSRSTPLRRNKAAGLVAEELQLDLTKIETGIRNSSRMLKKAAQQGRSERRGESYSGRTVSL
ncbi:MAG: hypothetical protein H0X01_02560 [Nitrospira sp.]|nr:hypothetical protein [Nitrospira sp.]